MLSFNDIAVSKNNDMKKPDDTDSPPPAEAITESPLSIEATKTESPPPTKKKTTLSFNDIAVSKNDNRSSETKQPNNELVLNNVEKSEPHNSKSQTTITKQRMEFSAIAEKIYLLKSNKVETNALNVQDFFMAYSDKFSLILQFCPNFDVILANMLVLCLQQILHEGHRSVQN